MLAIAPLAAFVVACGGERTPADEDPSAWAACDEFRKIAADISQGIVSPAELRPRLQSMDRKAQVAEDASVRGHARTLLRGATVGTTKEEADFAVAGLTEACRPYLR